MRINNIVIGYNPLSKNLSHPADRRRFIFFATYKNIKFEIADYNKKYDYVILTGLSDFTLWKNYKKGKIIFELLDPYLFENSSYLKNFLRSFGKFLLRQFKYFDFHYKKLLITMCKNSYAVICATKTHAELLKKYNKKIFCIPDFHGEFKSQKRTNSFLQQKKIKIFWEGYPINLLSKEFSNFIKDIKKNNLSNQIELNIVTDLFFHRYFNRIFKIQTIEILKKFDIQFNLYEWNIENIINISKKCDIGIIPLNVNNNYEKNKPENKLLLMWRLGLPTITSNTPAYKYLMDKVINNMIASEGNWSLHINNLIKNKEKLLEISNQNFEFISKYYNEEEISNLWEEVFTN